jgi:hypothetical protein
MSGSNTRCATCGTSILKRTADKHYGLCAPCYQQAVAKPPDDFEMPDDLVRRIESRDRDPESYRETAWRDGPDSVHRLLDSLDDVADEYQKWSPGLRTFAAECRRVAPTQAVENLIGPELAQYRLLRDKMSKFAESKEGLVTLVPRPHHLAVLSTSCVGLAAAEELFGRSGAVILEESERSRWFAQINTAANQGLWWYTFAWWKIQDGFDNDETERMRRRYPISPRNSYWVVESGVQWGPLAGGCCQELWRWDGAHAEFIETYGDLTF